MGSAGRRGQGSEKLAADSYDPRRSSRRLRGRMALAGLCARLRRSRLCVRARQLPRKHVVGAGVRGLDPRSLGRPAVPRCHGGDRFPGRPRNRRPETDGDFRRVVRGVSGFVDLFADRSIRLRGQPCGRLRLSDPIRLRLHARARPRDGWRAMGQPGGNGPLQPDASCQGIQDTDAGCTRGDRLPRSVRPGDRDLQCVQGDGAAGAPGDLSG